MSSVILKAVTLFCAIALFSGGSKADAAGLAARSIGLNVVLGDKQYYVGITQKINWYRALQICAARGLTLASIESETENTNLKNYLFANSILYSQFWLSGTDLALSREHNWVATGRRFNYTQWATQQPSTSTANRCVLTNTAFSWTKQNCASENYFICSRAAVPECGARGSCIYTYNEY